MGTIETILMLCAFVVALIGYAAGAATVLLMIRPWRTTAGEKEIRGDFVCERGEE